MSTDNHSPFSFRCEAITTDTISLPCAHSRLANVHHLQSYDSKVGHNHPDDPAVLIGLAFAFIRQGHLLDGHVPEPLTLRLSALADDGNAACRLLIGWLQNRNRDFRSPGNEATASVTPDVATVHASRRRRSPRDCAPTASSERGHIDGRRRIRTRSRDPVQNSETATIAAETGGRVDG